MATFRIEFVDLIPLEQISLDPDPIRQELNRAHIQDLIDSFNILPMGPLDPLIVKPIGENQYQIISGNHRYMALREGGWQDAPCHIIEPLNDAEEFLMKLHANTKRKNLNALEACEALTREKAIYETFYPQTKWGGNKSINPCAHFEHSDTQAFYQVKAKASGLGQSTIRRDLQIGHVVQEIPELKEANATKMEAYAIAQRKPEERLVVKKALQLSSNKPDTLKTFTRHEPRQLNESDADYAYRCFKDAHRLLKSGIDWKTLAESKLLHLIEEGILQELVTMLAMERDRIQSTLETEN